MFIFKLMKSKLLMGLAAVSLLLAIAAAVFFVRSFSHYDAVYYSNIQRSHQLFTVPGSLVFSTWTHLPSEDFRWSGESGRIGEVQLRLYRNGQETAFDKWDNPPGMTAGFWYHRGSFDQPAEGKFPAHTRYDTHLALPIWLVFLVLLLGPAIWVLKLLQRYKRAKHGHCIYCNTLMETPDVCPGCGREYEEWVL